jgi:hypothetical protein
MKHRYILSIGLLFLLFFIISINTIKYNKELFVTSKSTANVHTKLGEKQSTGGLPGMNKQGDKSKVIGGGTTPVPDSQPGGTQVTIGNTIIQYDKYGNIEGTSTPTQGSGDSTASAKKQIPATCPNGQPSGGFICCPNGQPSGGFSCCPDGTPSGGKPCKIVT